jgi:hypothetical protein
MVSKDRVEKAAEDYLRALISTSPASMVVKAILLGDSGNFTRAELSDIATGNRTTSTRRASGATRRSNTIRVPKKTRTVSKYQKRFGVHLKALKRKHPRTNISVLMKKAHRLTRKDMK